MSGLLPLLVASLVGSLHCAGMCGGLVGFYSGADAEKQPARAWWGHTFYHLSRLTGYVALGAAAGQLGSAVDRVGVLSGIQHTAAVLAGLLMVAWGLRTLLSPVRDRALIELRGKPSQAPRRAWLRTRLVATMRRARDLPTPLRAGLVGLCSGLLPCGWLHGFLLVAAGSGSAPRGALVLGALWLGSVPILLGVGVGVRMLSGRVRSFVPQLGAVLLVALGLFNVLGRWPSTPADAATPARHCHDVD